MAGKFYQTFMEEILPACNILIQKMEEEALPHLFYDVRNYPDTKDKDTTRKAIYPSTSW